MVTGRPPKYTIRDKRWMGNELKRNPPRLSPEKDNVSEELCAFVESILQVAPEKRPTAAELLMHPYISATERTYPNTSLMQLVIDFNRWEAGGGSRVSLYEPAGALPVDELSFDDAQESQAVADQGWRFSMFGVEGLANYQPADQANSPEVGNEKEGYTNTRGSQLQRAPNIKIDATHDYSSPFKKRESRLDTPFSSCTTLITNSAGDDYSDFAMDPPVEGAPQTQLDTHSAVEQTPKVQSQSSVNFDPRAAQRGGHQLANLFNERNPSYSYGKDMDSDSDYLDMAGIKSDLPLRNLASSTDVRSKEVTAPDPTKPRPLASSNVPDLSSIDMGTIKQNRMLNKSGYGPTQSDSSGDELHGGQSGRSIDAKRKTMDWQPVWMVDEAPAQPPPPQDPFTSFAFSGSGNLSSNNLAPPTAYQRPGLHQANSAPGMVPTTSSLHNPARVSTASMLDLDSLMGDQSTASTLPSQPSYESFFQTQQVTEPYDHPFEPMDEPIDTPDSAADSFDGLSLESSGGFDPVDLVQNGEHQPNDLEVFGSSVPAINTGSLLIPPNAQALGLDAPPELLEAELKRLIGQAIGELGEAKGDLLAAFDAESGDVLEDGEEFDEEDDDGERES